MFCKFCGQTLNASAVKCGRCGREIPARSDCGGFYPILPGTAPASQQPAGIPAEGAVKKQFPVLSVLVLLFLAAALVTVILQDGRLRELEKQVTELHEEVSDLSDELDDHLKATSGQPEQTLPDVLLPVDTLPPTTPVTEPETAAQGLTGETEAGASEDIPG